MACLSTIPPESSTKDLTSLTKPVIVQIELDLARMERVEYGNLKLCEHKFGLHAEKLNTLGADGTVRTKKMGNTRQSQRLYNMDDIRSWLTEASHKKPRAPSPT